MKAEQLKAACEAQGVKVDARFDFNKIIEILPYIIAILQAFGLVTEDEDEDKVG
jgi:hypothetical protein